MADISPKLVKELREKTGAGMMDCKKALTEADGNFEKAIELLRKKGASVAAKRAGKSANEGIVKTKISDNNKTGIILEVNCETDFVAKTDEFKHLAREVAMQVAAMNPADVDSLLKQEYIRDSSQTIEQLVKAVIGKLGENITVKRFVRFEL